VRNILEIYVTLLNMSRIPMSNGVFLQWIKTSCPSGTGTFHLRGLALQLSGKNPSFALQNTFHLRRFFT
jgi:hypothetical protein